MIKPSYRDILHPVLRADAASTATALGDALTGDNERAEQLLRDRLEDELWLLDDLDRQPDPGRDLFEVTVPDTGLVRVARRLHRVGVELVAAYNETAPDQRTPEITTGHKTGLKVVLLATYLMQGLPPELLDASDEPVEEVR
jgi:hypothetical protein